MKEKNISYPAIEGCCSEGGQTTSSQEMSKSGQTMQSLKTTDSACAVITAIERRWRRLIHTAYKHHFGCESAIAKDCLIRTIEVIANSSFGGGKLPPVRGHGSRIPRPMWPTPEDQQCDRQGDQLGDDQEKGNYKDS